MTPVGQVFAMCGGNQGGQARGQSSPGRRSRTTGTGEGSTSLHHQERILTVVNRHVSDSRETEIEVQGTPEVRIGYNSDQF